MSQKKAKRFWRAEVVFEHSEQSGNAKASAVYGQKRDNCTDCVKELEHFLKTYTSNSVVSIGIFKGYE